MSAARKKQQWIMVGLVMLILAFIFFIASNVLGRSPQNILGVGTGRIDTRIVADRTSGASPEDVWISNAEVQIQRLSEQIGALSKQLDASESRADQAVASLKDALEQKVTDLEGNTADAVMGLAGRIEEASTAASFGQTPKPSKDGVELTALDLGAAPPREFVRGGGNRIGNEFLGGSRTALSQNSVVQSNQGAGVATDPLIEIERKPFVTSFALTPKTKTKGRLSARTLDKYVPAGSYAPAVVLTGADAKTGTENLASPIPVVLKITGAAIGPSDGQRTSRINLQGCRVMGSAIADLSSERVSVRLDRISCVRDGEALEASVAGYVSGQGQQGVRGRLFSRAGPAVTNAAIAAALEGVAGAVGGTGSTIVGLDEAGKGDVLSSLPLQLGGGAAQGAASKLADYYIDRAEQISPVVSLFAGTEVNVVFLEGVDLAGE